MRKAIAVAVAVALSAPAASTAAPKPPCHKSVGDGVKAKGSPQNAPNKGRKCGFVP